MQSPKFHYPLGNHSKAIMRGGRFHRVTEANRSGIASESMHGRILLPNHTINEEKGSATLWIMPLEDMSDAYFHKQHQESNPLSNIFPLISDREATADIESANFAVYYWRHFWSFLVAKFSQGTREQCIWNINPKLTAMAEIELHARKWHQVSITWDKPSSTLKIYLDGILAAHSDTTSKKSLGHNVCGTFVYLGCPAMAYSDIAFYDHCIPSEQIDELYRSEMNAPNHISHEKLRGKLLGTHLLPFDAPDISNWKERLNLPLNKTEDLTHFYIQGDVRCYEVATEGLIIKTESLEEWFKTGGAGRNDQSRSFLWTHEIFRGDLYVEFEFQLLDHGGLALIMIQSAGMQGEDFLDEYPMRTNGRMKVVHWSDVRNYDWEFYREMSDTRNDVASHSLVKNPWYHKRGIQMEGRQWKTNQWYRLRCIQRGTNIQCAIDNTQIFDITDRSDDGSGPTLHHGRVAIRAMMRTHMQIRNFRVLENPIIQAEEL